MFFDRNPQESCTYLTDSFKSRCTQIFNYHRLLSWDKYRGLHVDIFKVPTCCSCHVDGYRETFPPLYGKNEYDHSYKTSLTDLKNTKYSTINFDDDDDDEDLDDDDLEELPSYYKSIYKSHQPKTTYKTDSSYLGSAKINRYERPQTTPKPKSHISQIYETDSYLTPPTASDEVDEEYSLKRGPQTTSATKRKRRPSVNRREQQVPSDNDFIPRRINIENIAITTSRPEKVRVQTTPLTFSKRTTNSTIPIPTITSKIPSSPKYKKSMYKFPIQTTPYLTTTKIPLPTRPTTMPTTTPSSTTSVNDFPLNKRVNYNYHPIIDFFEEAEDNADHYKTIVNRSRVPEQSLGNRMGIRYNGNNFNTNFRNNNNNLNTRWQPMIPPRQRLRTHHRY